MNALLAARETAPENAFIERAVSFIDATPHAAAQEKQCYGFRIGPLGFLFPENCSGEIVVAPEICPIPYTEKWMPGVVASRGTLIPVFDLHELLLETPADLHKPMILILDQGKQALGFVLKEPPQWLTGLVEVPVAAPQLPDQLATLVNKVYLQNETSWLAFDKTELFTFLAESAKSC